MGTDETACLELGIYRNSELYLAVNIGDLFQKSETAQLLKLFSCCPLAEMYKAEMAKKSTKIVNFDIIRLRHIVRMDAILKRAYEKRFGRTHIEMFSYSSMAGAAAAADSLPFILVEHPK